MGTTTGCHSVQQQHKNEREDKKTNRVSSIVHIRWTNHRTATEPLASSGSQLVEGTIHKRAEAPCSCYALGSLNLSGEVSTGAGPHHKVTDVTRP
jgi:hypothetical protein